MIKTRAQRRLYGDTLSSEDQLLQESVLSVHQFNNVEDTLCQCCFYGEMQDQVALFGDKMVKCERCNISVHRRCYGVTTNGTFICEPCQRGRIGPYHNSYFCVICGQTHGALKFSSESKTWIHVLCALMHPTVCKVRNLRDMTDISVNTHLSISESSLIDSLQFPILESNHIKVGLISGSCFSAAAATLPPSSNQLIKPEFPDGPILENQQYGLDKYLNSPCIFCEDSRGFKMKCCHGLIRQSNNSGNNNQNTLDINSKISQNDIKIDSTMPDINESSSSATTASDQNSHIFSSLKTQSNAHQQLAQFKDELCSAAAHIFCAMHHVGVQRFLNTPNRINNSSFNSSYSGSQGNSNFVNSIRDMNIAGKWMNVFQTRFTPSEAEGELPDGACDVGFDNEMDGDEEDFENEDDMNSSLDATGQQQRIVKGNSTRARERDIIRMNLRESFFKMNGHRGGACYFFCPSQHAELGRFCICRETREGSHRNHKTLLCDVCGDMLHVSCAKMVLSTSTSSVFKCSRCSRQQRLMKRLNAEWQDENVTLQPLQTVSGRATRAMLLAGDVPIEQRALEMLSAKKSFNVDELIGSHLRPLPFQSTTFFAGALAAIVRTLIVADARTRLEFLASKGLVIATESPDLKRLPLSLLLSTPSQHFGTLPVPAAAAERSAIPQLDGPLHLPGIRIASTDTIWQGCPRYPWSDVPVISLIQLKNILSACKQSPIYIPGCERLESICERACNFVSLADEAIDSLDRELSDHLSFMSDSRHFMFHPSLRFWCTSSCKYCHHAQRLHDKYLIAATSHPNYTQNPIESKKVMDAYNTFLLSVSPLIGLEIRTFEGHERVKQLQVKLLDPKFAPIMQAVRSNDWSNVPASLLDECRKFLHSDSSSSHHSAVVAGILKCNKRLAAARALLAKVAKQPTPRAREVLSVISAFDSLPPDQQSDLNNLRKLKARIIEFETNAKEKLQKSLTMPYELNLLDGESALLSGIRSPVPVPTLDAAMSLMSVSNLPFISALSERWASMIGKYNEWKTKHLTIVKLALNIFQEQQQNNKSAQNKDNSVQGMKKFPEAKRSLWVHAFDDAKGLDFFTPELFVIRTAVHNCILWSQRVRTHQKERALQALAVEMKSLLVQPSAQTQKLLQQTIIHVKQVKHSLIKVANCQKRIPLEAAKKLLDDASACGANVSCSREFAAVSSYVKEMQKWTQCMNLLTNNPISLANEVLDKCKLLLNDPNFFELNVLGSFRPQDDILITFPSSEDMMVKNETEITNPIQSYLNTLLEMKPFNSQEPNSHQFSVFILLATLSIAFLLRLPSKAIKSYLSDEECIMINKCKDFIFSELKMSPFIAAISQITSFATNLPFPLAPPKSIRANFSFMAFTIPLLLAAACDSSEKAIKFVTSSIGTQRIEQLLQSDQISHSIIKEGFVVPLTSAAWVLRTRELLASPSYASAVSLSNLLKTLPPISANSSPEDLRLREEASQVISECLAWHKETRVLLSGYGVVLHSPFFSRAIPAASQSVFVASPAIKGWSYSSFLPNEARKSISDHAEVLMRAKQVIEVLSNRGILADSVAVQMIFDKVHLNDLPLTWMVRGDHADTMSCLSQGLVSILRDTADKGFRTVMKQDALTSPSNDAVRIESFDGVSFGSHPTTGNMSLEDCRRLISSEWDTLLELFKTITTAVGKQLSAAPSMVDRDPLIMHMEVFNWALRLCRELRALELNDKGAMKKEDLKRLLVEGAGLADKICDLKALPGEFSASTGLPLVPSSSFDDVDGGGWPVWEVNANDIPQGLLRKRLAGSRTSHASSITSEDGDASDSESDKCSTVEEDDEDDALAEFMKNGGSFAEEEEEEERELLRELGLEVLAEGVSESFVSHHQEDEADSKKKRVRAVAERAAASLESSDEEEGKDDGDALGETEGQMDDMHGLLTNGEEDSGKSELAAVKLRSAVVDKFEKIRLVKSITEYAYDSIVIPSVHKPLKKDAAGAALENDTDSQQQFDARRSLFNARVISSEKTVLGSSIEPCPLHAALTYFDDGSANMRTIARTAVLSYLSTMEMLIIRLVQLLIPSVVSCFQLKRLESSLPCMQLLFSLAQMFEKDRNTKLFTLSVSDSVVFCIAESKLLSDCLIFDVRQLIIASVNVPLSSIESSKMNDLTATVCEALPFMRRVIRFFDEISWHTMSNCKEDFTSTKKLQFHLSKKEKSDYNDSDEEAHVMLVPESLFCALSSLIWRCVLSERFASVDPSNSTASASSILRSDDVRLGLRIFDFLVTTTIHTLPCLRFNYSLRLLFAPHTPNQQHHLFFLRSLIQSSTHALCVPPLAANQKSVAVSRVLIDRAAFTPWESLHATLPIPLPLLPIEFLGLFGLFLHNSDCSRKIDALLNTNAPTKDRHAIFNTFGVGVGDVTKLMIAIKEQLASVMLYLMPSIERFNMSVSEWIDSSISTAAVAKHLETTLNASSTGPTPSNAADEEAVVSRNLSARYPARTIEEVNHLANRLHECETLLCIPPSANSIKVRNVLFQAIEKFRASQVSSDRMMGRIQAVKEVIPSFTVPVSKRTARRIPLEETRPISRQVTSGMTLVINSALKIHQEVSSFLTLRKRCILVLSEFATRDTLYKETNKSTLWPTHSQFYPESSSASLPPSFTSLAPAAAGLPSPLQMESHASLIIVLANMAHAVSMSPLLDARLEQDVNDRIWIEAVRCLAFIGDPTSHLASFAPRVSTLRSLLSHPTAVNLKKSNPNLNTAGVVELQFLEHLLNIARHLTVKAKSSPREWSVVRAISPALPIDMVDELEIARKKFAQPPATSSTGTGGNKHTPQSSAGTAAAVALIKSTGASTSTPASAAANIPIMHSITAVMSKASERVSNHVSGDPGLKEHKSNILERIKNLPQPTPLANLEFWPPESRLKGAGSVRDVTTALTGVSPDSILCFDRFILKQVTPGGDTAASALASKTSTAGVGGGNSKSIKVSAFGEFIAVNVNTPKPDTPLEAKLLVDSTGRTGGVNNLNETANELVRGLITRQSMGFSGIPSNFSETDVALNILSFAASRIHAHINLILSSSSTYASVIAPETEIILQSLKSDRFTPPVANLRPWIIHCMVPLLARVSTAQTSAKLALLHAVRSAISFEKAIADETNPPTKKDYAIAFVEAIFNLSSRAEPQPILPRGAASASRDAAIAISASAASTANSSASNTANRLSKRELLAKQFLKTLKPSTVISLSKKKVILPPGVPPAPHWCMSAVSLFATFPSLSTTVKDATDAPFDPHAILSDITQFDLQGIISFEKFASLNLAKKLKDNKFFVYVLHTPWSDYRLTAEHQIQKNEPISSSADAQALLSEFINPFCNVTPLIEAAPALDVNDRNIQKLEWLASNLPVAMFQSNSPKESIAVRVMIIPPTLFPKEFLDAFDLEDSSVQALLPRIPESIRTILQALPSLRSGLFTALVEFGSKTLKIPPCPTLMSSEAVAGDLRSRLQSENASQFLESMASKLQPPLVAINDPWASSHATSFTFRNASGQIVEDLTIAPPPPQTFSPSLPPPGFSDLPHMHANSHLPQESISSSFHPPPPPMLSHGQSSSVRELSTHDDYTANGGGYNGMMDQFSSATYRERDRTERFSPPHAANSRYNNTRVGGDGYAPPADSVHQQPNMNYASNDFYGGNKNNQSGSNFSQFAPAMNQQQHHYQEHQQDYSTFNQPPSQHHQQQQHNQNDWSSSNFQNYNRGFNQNANNNYTMDFTSSSYTNNGNNNNNNTNNYGQYNHNQYRNNNAPYQQQQQQQHNNDFRNGPSSHLMYQQPPPSHNYNNLNYQQNSYNNNNQQW